MWFLFRKKTYHFWIKVFSPILLIASLLTSCHLPWQRTPEVAEIELRDIPQGIETAEPRDDLPPTLVEVDPISGSTIALNQPISLYFNQAMDTDSVEAALRFDPRVNGLFSWKDDQVLTFIPDQALSPGADLSLVINTSAQAANRKGLQTPIELNYQTADALMVSQIMPADLSQDVDPESVIFATFNQPVVPLGAEQSGLPAFSISPEVPGEGKWLNTTTYIFTPASSMAGGTTYTISLNESLSATSGARLGSQQLEFSFQTTKPRVIEVLPLGSAPLSLDGPIEVRFNIRMDPTSVEDNFSLVSPTGSLVNGSFEWQDDLQEFNFIPEELLDRNTRYVIEIAEEAQSFGGIPLEKPYEMALSTYRALNVDPSSLPSFTSYYGQYGQYTIYFTAPIAKEDYKTNVSIDPEVISEGWYLSSDNNWLNVNGYFKPDTEYTVTLDGSLEDKWGGRLGQTLTYTFVTPSAEPSLSVFTGYTSYNLMFVPEEDPEILIQATNINTITFEIAPISVNDLLTLIHPDNYEYREVFLPANLEATTHNLQLPRNVNQGVTLPLTYQRSPLQSGIYFLGITSSDLFENNQQEYQKFYLIVSQNHVVMKVSPEQAFIWGTQLADYSPLADTPVSIYNAEGDLVTGGETDSDGFFINEISRFDSPYTSFLTILGKPGQDDFGFSISTWDQGYALYEMGIRQNTLPPETQAYLYTDRPIYRPGDTLHFKAVIYGRENGLPVSSGLDQVDVTVYGDPGMSGIPVNLYSQEHTLSQFGTVTGTVEIPEDASPGLFNIALTKDEKMIESLYFEVAAYRKPEIEMSLEITPSDILAGENLSAAFTANYYFGLPAAEQPFSWTLFRDDADFDLPGYRVGPLDTSWLMPRMPGYMSLGDAVDRGSGMTDGDGQSQLRFTENDMALDETEPGSTQKISIEVSVTDETNLPVTYRESALVHPESFYIGVKPESYFGNANTPFSFSVISVDWSKEPVGQVPLEATFEAIEWEVEETGSLDMPYRYVEETTQIDTASPITGADGLTRIAFTPPEPGTYQLRVESGGAVTEVLVWVGGESSPVWPQRIQSLIDLTPDAETYEVGDRAQVFFPNPFPGNAKALVTIERGRVMETRVVDVVGAGYTLQIPVTRESIPNVYLSVMLFGRNESGEPGFRQGITNLKVQPSIKTLNVQLLVNPTQTEPGEDVSAEIRITDHQGNPVQGEFSIAVVDKALLALVEPNSLPIMDEFYSTQPLAVQTSYSLKTYAMKLALSSQVGIGGGGGWDMVAEPTIREDFPDTALWEGQIVTGSDGTAQLEIPLPDSLTTWVVDVRGLTEDYAVGQSEAEIVTQKKLMIRPITPRFLVDGDRVEMAAVVHNNTENSLEVDVSLLGSGFSIEQGTDVTQRILLEPGDSERINWWGTVESRESIELIFQAESGDLVDASKPNWGDLRVLRYAMPSTTSTAGQLDEEGGVLELVSLPISTEVSSGSLRLELQPSLTAGIIDGLEALNTPSYSDTLSLLSRMLANISTYQSLQDLGIESPQLASDLPDLVGVSLHEILDSQRFDGGWSWWGGMDVEIQPSDPFITAYVLLGLRAAADAGFEVGDHYIDQGEAYLSNNLISPGNIEEVWELDRLAFQIYALRDSGMRLTGQVDAVFNRRSDLSPWALGLFAMALNRIDGGSGRVDTLLGDLETSAVRSETGVNWESQQTSWMLPGTPLFNTAVGVLTLSELDPASASLPPALRYLMAHRKGGDSGGAPFESAWVLMAITGALKGTGDYQADYEFQASLNGRLLAEGESTTTTIETMTSILDLYPDSPNALMIERGEGPGTLYYRADLETYRPAVDAEPINKGIILEREYYLTGEGCPGQEDCIPIDSLVLAPDDPSQMITVVLTINLSNDMVNLMLEDFIPSGTEILNKDFLTSISVQTELIDTYHPRKPFEYGWGWWYFNQPEISDDHILWTADYIPAGTYILTYELIPYQRGDFQVLPSHAWMYFYPEVQGTSAGSLFSIQ